MSRQASARSAKPRESRDTGILADFQKGFAAEGSPPRFLDGLSDTEKRLVALESRVVRIRRGEIIFRQGTAHDGIYVIRSGRVRTFFVAPSGRELTLAYWAPHHFVGAPEVFGTGDHQWSGVAVTDSELLHLEAARLRHMATTMPGLAIALIEGLVFKCRRFSILAQMLATQSASARLAHVLLDLSDVQRQTQGCRPDGAEITIVQKFSHDQLASMIGASRQWVSTTLSCWYEEKILRRDGRRIVVMDLTKLAAQCHH